MHGESHRTANTRSLRRLCLAVLLGSAPSPCWSIEALPCVGRVSSATRTLSVIGTVHTPSRQQLREVAQLIRSTRPDVVLVELDQPRLEQLLKQQHRAGPLGGPPTLGAELAEAVAVAAACDTPVVLGDAVLPLDALWRDRPFLDAPRLWRAARLRLRRRFPGVEVHPNPNPNPNPNPSPNPNRSVEVHPNPDPDPKPSHKQVRRVSVARTFADDPQKAAPLLLSVGLTAALLG